MARGTEFKVMERDKVDEKTLIYIHRGDGKGEVLPEERQG
jgi:hypothetical protein